MPKQKYTRKIWIRLVEYSSFETGSQADLRVLDNIMLTHTSDSLVKNTDSSSFFEKIIQRTKITLIMRVRLAKISIWTQIADLNIDAK